MEEKAERCWSCKYCDMNRDLEYYNYPYCKKNGREINFSEENGWNKMKWCPIEKENEKE